MDFHQSMSGQQLPLPTVNVIYDLFSTVVSLIKKFIVEHFPVNVLHIVNNLRLNRVDIFAYVQVTDSKWLQETMVVQQLVFVAE